MAISETTINQVTRRPGSERARERRFQGARGPRSELARVLLADSLRGANWPGSEKAVNPCGQHLVSDNDHVSTC